MPYSRSAKLSMIATAPTRIDLAGGTLDLWPIHHLLNEKATVNFGITLNAKSICSLSDEFSIKSNDLGLSQKGTFSEIIQNPKIPLISLLLQTFWSNDLPPISIETTAESPAGAGIGGSSCLGITLAAALNSLKNALGLEPRLDSEHLVKTVQDAESKLIKAPTGVQDYWGAIRGNLNVIEFPFGKTLVETLNLPILKELNDNLIVVYSGQSRASALNNWEIFKKLYDGDTELLLTFQKIGKIAYQCAKALRQGDLKGALESSKEEWELRKKLWPNIETPVTQKIDTLSIEYGAFFTRVCGAGGGGVMAVFAPKEKHQIIREKITSCGAIVLNAQVAFYGLSVNPG